MKSVLREQYAMVLSSRSVLFAYCQSIPMEMLQQPLPEFNQASMLYLLMHNANCYRFWIGEVALQKNINYFDYKKSYSWDELEKAYKEVDNLVEQFLSNEFQDIIPYEIRGLKGTTSPLKLLTHTMTHEFHHKGQILSMSRQFGFTPIDTDILR